jgi:phosphatidate cytidylyltransferase
MLGWRLVMSAILIPSIIGLFWLDHRIGAAAPVLLGFCILVAFRNAWELCDLLTVRNLRPSLPATAVASLLMVLAGWTHRVVGDPAGGATVLVSLGWLGGALILIYCAFLMMEAARYREAGQSMESLGVNLLIVFYAGALIATTAQLRWFPNPATGYFVIASVVICVKSGDTFAYTFGRLWGRTKLVPRLSPGKTRMGLVGAIFGSTLGGTLWLTFAGRLFSANPQAGPLWITLLYSASFGLIGLVGDLVESLIKRDTGKKDSAALMPGFGGLLDLLDSPLFAGPFALLWWHLLPPVVLPL